MEAIIEAILGFLFELFLQIMSEFFCELGMRALSEALQCKQVKNPISQELAIFFLEQSWV